MGVHWIETDMKSVKQRRQRETAAALVFVHLAESDTPPFDATTIAEHGELFDRWVENLKYSVGHIRLDESNGCLYRCLEGHTAGEADKHAPSKSKKWEHIVNPSDPWPQWFPYIGTVDAWMNGDRCSHNGKRYVCLVDYNVWEPGEQGWEVIE